MSTETNALALHEILLSIADSLNEAQHQLRSMPPYDEYGRPNTIYQLPYLDFNLEVISQFESTDKSNGNAAKSGMLNVLKFVPFKNTDTGSTVTNKIVSNISGKFVAILPNEGLPQVYLSTQTEILSDTEYKYKITVKLQQATKEPVVGQRIEVNFDEATSLAINGTDLVSSPTFKNKEGFTDLNGEFITELTMGGTDYTSGKTIIIVANCGTIFSSRAISKV